jgi:nitrogen fixation protein NifU and related proteins
MVMKDDEFEAIVGRIQQEVFAETRSVFGDVGFERWRKTRYNGRMADADTFARIRGKCGDTMEIYLKFKDGVVEKASYFTDGCGSSAICGSFAAELAIGRNPDQICRIGGEEVLARIGVFPQEEEHCARLAAETLHEALHQYMLKESAAGQESGG